MPPASTGSPRSHLRGDQDREQLQPLCGQPPNAYGLMQVIPATAGRDVYVRVRGRDAADQGRSVQSGPYNIDVGTACLHSADRLSGGYPGSPVPPLCGDLRLQRWCGRCSTPSPTIARRPRHDQPPLPEAVYQVLTETTSQGRGSPLSLQGQSGREGVQANRRKPGWLMMACKKGALGALPIYCGLKDKTALAQGRCPTFSRCSTSTSVLFQLWSTSPRTRIRSSGPPRYRATRHRPPPLPPRRCRHGTGSFRHPGV